MSQVKERDAGLAVVVYGCDRAIQGGRMGAIFDLVPLPLFGLALVITFLAGFVKGAVGFALPLIIISGLGAIMPPEIALAGLILPAVVTNIWQAFRQGIRGALSSILGHWPFITIGLGVMVVSAQLVLALPQWLFFAAIGVPITLFSATQLIGWQLRVAPHRRALATVLFGAIGGVLGGFAAIWGPPTVAYLTSLDVEKREHVRVQGMVYFLGGIGLFASHLRSGVLNADTVPFSALLVVPALAGMWAGQRMQDRMDRTQFLRATLLVLLVAGLNLVRRAFFA
jgi:uncharacterized protein